VNVVIILNARAGPASRRVRREDVESRARAVLARRGADSAVLLTEGPGHARELARRAVADGADIVCAWGGDGTVNEVASGLASGGGILAIVPAGSGNGFARDLGIPMDKDAALKVAVRGVTRVVDVGEANGRMFVATAGLGFDAHVAHAFARGTHGARGPAAYVVAAVLEMFAYRACRCRLEIDGAGVLEARVTMVGVANTRQWGNNACFAPRAVPDDGVLDVVAIADRPVLVLATQAWRLWNGSIGRVKGVSMYTCRSAVVTSEAPLPLHIDGEPAGVTDRLVVSVRPQALSVRVPVS
jgi:YegS/Rv2252/BmrU family lipid kinase